jgi:Tol biopolymer transport system component
MWSPFGVRIAYSSQVNGIFDLVEKPLAGGEPRLVLHTADSKQIPDWSRDGRYILYRSVTRLGADMDIWAAALEGDRTPFPVVRTPFEERDAQFSPNGKWIAYQSNQSGRPEVYIQSFKPGAESLPVSLKGAFSRNGVPTAESCSTLRRKRNSWRCQLSTVVTVPCDQVSRLGCFEPGWERFRAP